MLSKSPTLLALAAFTAQSVTAQQYIDLSQIKYLYTTGASVDWWGPPVNGAPDYANTANGPNWIEYLSYSRGWQISRWAYPGAVTNASVVPPNGNSAVIDWPNQLAYVKGQFNSDSSSYGGATGANSLFIISASNTGNDILNSYNDKSANTPDARSNAISQLLQTIGTGLNQLHAMGARNFIFQSVLPVHRIPQIQNQGASVIADVQSYVQQYDTALSNLAKYLAATYSDSNIYYPNFTQPFYDAQDGKLSGPTAGYLSRGSYCPNLGSQLIGEFNPRQPNFNDCPYGARARQFLFYDQIHFTSPLHCEYAYRTLFSLVGFNAQYPGNCQYASGTD